MENLPPYRDEDGDWEGAAAVWLSAQNQFTRQNVKRFRAFLERAECGARMVVNIDAYALLCFLRDLTYRNHYDRKVRGVSFARAGGVRADSDEQRQRVDALIAPAGTSGADIYFGAVALESAGVRFYGEYCLVLKAQELDPATQILDRDSYELDFAPLGPVGEDEAASHALLNALKGTWARDLVAMAILKARRVLEDADRCTSEGRLTDELLFGEEFIEVHRVGAFGPNELEEVRQSDVEIATSERILTAFEHGVVPSLEELVWLVRRAEVDRSLKQARLPTRVVSAVRVR
jgi:hypothetical protein